MGKQPLMGITGRIGNIIHYKMDDKFYTRAAPRKFKQTKATKKRASEFGRASTMGCAIRGLLIKSIPNPSDRKMHGRLVGVLFRWLRNFNKKTPGVTHTDIIEDFNFTGSSTVRGRWAVDLQLKNPSPGLVQLYIPGFLPKELIRAPAGSVSVVCRIAIGTLDVATGMALDKSFTELVYKFDGKPVEEKTISMELPTPKDCLILTGISLTYRSIKNGREFDFSIKKFMPAGIHHVLYV